MLLKATRRMIAVLPRRKRWELVVILIAVLIAAGLEIVSIGMLIPFLVVAADPGIIDR